MLGIRNPIIVSTLKKRKKEKSRHSFGGE